jgi:hypothetical protein
MQPELSEVGIAQRGLQRLDDLIAHENAAIDAWTRPEIGPCQGSGRNRDVAILDIIDFPQGLARRGAGG